MRVSANGLVRSSGSARALRCSGSARNGAAGARGTPRRPPCRAGRPRCPCARRSRRSRGVSRVVLSSVAAGDAAPRARVRAPAAGELRRPSSLAVSYPRGQDGVRASGRERYALCASTKRHGFWSPPRTPMRAVVRLRARARRRGRGRKASGRLPDRQAVERAVDAESLGEPRRAGGEQARPLDAAALGHELEAGLAVQAPAAARRRRRPLLRRPCWRRSACRT